MLDGVRDRLARDEICGGLDLRRQTLFRRRHDLDRDGSPSCKRLERAGEPFLGEDCRMHATGELAQLFDRRLELVDSRREDPLDLRVELRPELALCQPEL